MYVHKYDTRGCHDLRVSDCSTCLYHNGVFCMGMRLYDKLLKKSRLHTLNIINREFKSVLLQNNFYTVEKYLQAAL